MKPESEHQDRPASLAHGKGRWARILTGVAIATTSISLFCLLSPSRSIASSSVAASPATTALQRIVLEPKEIRLAHPRATQRLVVTGYYADGTEHDVSRLCRYVSSSPEVLTVSPEGVVKALSPGESGIEARLEDTRSDIQVSLPMGQ